MTNLISPFELFVAFNLLTILFLLALLVMKEFSDNNARKAYVITRPAGKKVMKDAPDYYYNDKDN